VVSLVSVPGTGGLMADWEGIPARERRQMEEILQLDMEELNVEVVDDNDEEEEEEEGDGNEEDDDIDAYLR
jgi:cereblon